jgi:hypothetical protein
VGRAAKTRGPHNMGPNMGPRVCEGFDAQGGPNRYP